MIAFAEDVAVPGRGLEAVGFASEVGPENFHGTEFCLRGHLVERENGFHGGQGDGGIGVGQGAAYRALPTRFFLRVGRQTGGGVSVVW